MMRGKKVNMKNVGLHVNGLRMFVKGCRQSIILIQQLSLFLV